MEQKKRILIAALAVVALGLGGTAYAVKGEADCRGAMAGKSPAAFAGARLDKLHAELKLAPEQEKAWADWSAPIKARAASMKKPDFEAMSKLPAPDRMEQMLERMKERQKEMEAGLAVTRSFYGVLTPAQRQVFDAFKPFGDHDGRSHGRRGKPDRG